MSLDEIKQMMAVGETAHADEALKALLEAEPDNLQAKMLYGTCRQLLGDEETFRRIHDELAPEMEKPNETETQPEVASLWRKYHALWLSLIVGGLVLAGVGAVWWNLSSTFREGPEMREEEINRVGDPRATYQLYGPAIREKRFIEPSN